MRSKPLSTLPWRARPLAELIRLSWPITVSQISFSLMTAVDTMFVGSLGASALAGVALGGIATYTLLCFGIGMLRATKISVAHAVGAGQTRAAQAYLGASLWIALVLGVAFALFGQLTAAMLPGLTDGGASGAIAAEYASLRVLCAPLLLIDIALRENRQAVGDARSPMIATILANLVNVGLVAWFLFGLEWGVAGVAWASSIAQLVEALVLALRQRPYGFGLRVWLRADLRTVFRLGVPLGIERFFDVASFSVMVAICARMGDVDLAAHQVANQALLFAFMPSQAIGEAACVLMGQAVGAASMRTVPRVQRAALLVSFGYVTFVSCVMLLCGPYIAALFTSEQAVVARADSLFDVAAVFVWILPFYQIGQASLRAIGDVRVAAWITVLAAWGCTPVFTAVFGLGLGMGAKGGWIGIGCELGLAALLFWWRLQGRGGAWLRTARRCSSALRLPQQPVIVTH
jgi:MATE family multidrug resistance protein